MQANVVSRYGPQGTNWVFTWNNYTDKLAPQAWPDVVQLVYQCEIAPDTGTPHLQGYVRFDKNKRMSALKKLSPAIHWEKRYGTHVQAYEYCSKEETRDPAPDSGPWFIGVQPEPGKRNDLEEAARLLREGMSVKALAAQMPLVAMRYNRGLQFYKMCVTPHRTEQTELIIYWGPPGSGKSHHVRSRWPEAFWLSRSNGQGMWWDGYGGEKIVVLDEFTGWMTKDLFCRLIDSTPFVVDTKGGRISFAAELVVCTSNEDPWTWWEPPLYGVERRLKEAQILYMDKNVAEKYRKKRKYEDELQPAATEDNEEPQRAVSTSNYGEPVAVPGGYAVPGYTPSSGTAAGWQSSRSCQEPGCTAAWIVGGTGYCIKHGQE